MKKTKAYDDEIEGTKGLLVICTTKILNKIIFGKMIPYTPKFTNIGVTIILTIVPPNYNTDLSSPINPIKCSKILYTIRGTTAHTENNI